MKDHRPLAVIGLMIGLAAGSIATIPAVVLAVASAGVGHGTYSLARLLYPHAMLIWLSSRGEFSPPTNRAVAGPISPLRPLIGAAWPWRRWRMLTACAVLVVHLLAAGACFGDHAANPS